MATEDAAAVDEDPRFRLLSQTLLELPRNISSLENASRPLPIEEDFHFLHNFNEFVEPVHALMARAENVMLQIASLTLLNNRAPAWPSDTEDLTDWLVAVQDEILEQADTAFDQFKTERRSKGLPADDDGFIVPNRKRRRKDKKIVMDANTVNGVQLRVDGAKAHLSVDKDARFHKWEVPRPQEKFLDTIDNSNKPFMHPDNAHPLQEKLDNIDFETLLEVGVCDPKQPESLSDTPFTFVNTASTLMELASKLSQEREIAVDLEHNNFRSFQGITCLMQITTHKEDYIIDTLALRHLIGPQLSSIFANDAIQKVMHGADLDITWLQRDFGIYVCNLFDTGQAARVLKMERYSLAYLLEHFCGVIPDKRYQMADWRDRPLSDKMMKYAREDTHYLLYVADKMKRLLDSASCDDCEKPLLETYKRSRDICLKLYKKENTTETSFLQVYGLVKRKFRAEQLSVLAGLYLWRDTVARMEDESTGYILPNKLLLALAEEMPDNVKKLQTIVDSKSPILIHNLATVIAVINKSRLNASTFEGIAVRLQTEETNLKDKEPGAMHSPGLEVLESNEELCTIVSKTGQVTDAVSEGHEFMNNEVSDTVNYVSSTSEELKELQREWESFNELKVIEQVPTESIKMAIASSDVAVVVKRASTSSLFGKQRKPMQSSKNKEKQDNMNKSWETDTFTHMQKEVIKIVNELEKPSDQEKQETLHACMQPDSSMFINDNGITSHSDSKQGMELSGDLEKVEAKSKAEKIKSSFSLPFHAFGGEDVSDELVMHSEDKILKHEDEMQNNEIENLDYIEIDAKECCQDDDQTENGIAINADGTMHKLYTLGELPQESTPMEMSNASDSEQQFPLPLSQRYRIQKAEVDMKHKTLDVTMPKTSCKKTMIENHSVVITPFDYAAAKKLGNLRKHNSRKDQMHGTSENQHGSSKAIFNPTKKVAGFRPEGITPGKRRQVFPQSGNRTGVFK